MADDKKDGGAKPRMLTEEEHNKRLTEELAVARNKRMTYSIQNGWDHYGSSLAPEATITIKGGDARKVHELVIAIEKLVLAFAEANPPPEAP